MNIKLTKEKNYIEVLPCFAIGRNPMVIYIGWLMWNIVITK